MDSVPTSAWVSLGLGATALLFGLVWLEPLPPTVSVFYGLPPLALGVALWIGATFGTDIGVYGRFLGGLPAAGHAAVRVFSALVTAAAVLWLLKQPGAESAPLERRLATLDGVCTEQSERVQRGLIEVLEAIETGMAAQTPAGRARSAARLTPAWERCRERTREAFADPRGTHRSWRILRDWLREHPVEAELPPDPLWTEAHRPRQRKAAPRAVELAP